MTNLFDELKLEPRILLGPGPSNISPSVVQAMAAPLMGYLDPDFVKVMDDVQEMLRLVFRLNNGFAFPVSGTGTAGMEATIANITEPDDVIIIAANGFFSQRMTEMVKRHGGIPKVLEIPWGEPVTVDILEKELKQHSKVKAVTIVHAETSTGVLTPLPDLSHLIHSYDALLLVDAVTSLCGSELDMDSWGIDLCYSASQKCVGTPPGLSPVGISSRAMDIIRARKDSLRTWYLDLSLLEQYWSQGVDTPNRVYHHTAPISMIYGLREALRLVLEEGLENRINRHITNAKALRAGIRALGLNLLVDDPHWLPQLTTVGIPDGIDDAQVRRRLLRESNIEIGGGLGEFKGNTWRIGLMGEASKATNVLNLLEKLEIILSSEGFDVAHGAAVSAATELLG